MAHAAALAAPPSCGGCGAELGPDLLVCPGCGRLVHADALASLAGEAEAAEAAGSLAAARERWRRIHALLPPTTRQAEQVGARIAALNRRLEQEGAPPETDDAASRGAAARFGVIGAIALFVLTKGKLLLVGLSKSSTVFTMLASFGVYWTAFGWPFALGLVVSIYVHEMGHVEALRRRGIDAGAPMFVPGLGAFVRMKHRPADVVEDARIGLAGPIFGLAAAAICWGVFAATSAPLFAALARTGAWINLFNLMPLGPLDGGRAFGALSTGQRWLVCAGLAGAWLASHEGMLLLVGVVAVFRAMGGAAPAAGDRRTLLELIGLVAALTLLAALPVPGATP